MGFLGGELVYQFLKTRYPGGQGVPMSSGNPYAETNRSKFKTLFGPDIFDELKGKTIVDFGCGDGENVVEMCQAGCTSVVGIDIQDNLLAIAKEKAIAAGVADRCVFVREWKEPVDIVVTTDAFEHFADPAGMLRLMKGLLKPDGYVLVEFGYTWYHPLGGHLFSVFPWSHLLFTEKTLMRWRTDFKTDGATRFHECAGGLNRMTLARWERIVKQEGMTYKTYKLHPIRAVRRFHCFLTRELFTSVITARLVKE